jgi:uncharacterized protein with NRDE domain
MCIALIIIEEIENFPVVIFHNRDVEPNKESTGVEYDEENGIYQGKVIFSGGTYKKLKKGTWFGVSDTNYNFACILDIDFDEYHKITHSLSRGRLVQMFIKDKENGFEEFQNNYMKYKALNMIYGNIKTKKVYYCSNRTNEIFHKVQKPIEIELKVKI